MLASLLEEVEMLKVLRGFMSAIAVVLTAILLVITFVYVRQIVKTEDVR